MKTTIASALLFFIGLLPHHAVPVSAQQPSLFHELGGYFLTTSSDHPELPGPVGFGVQATWEFAELLMARLSYYRVSDDTEKDGTVCDQYSQRINCRDEITQTDATLSGLKGTLLLSIPLGEMARVSAGGGLSFNHVDTESIGTVSGLEADLLAPNAGIIGFTSLLTAAIRPVQSVPLTLTGGVGMHWVNFDTCSGNDPPQYDPYCGRERFTELELGMAIAFR